MSSKFRFRYK